MTIAYIDVAKAPVQVPVIDLLQEPQGAAFDFISGQAWIVDKVNPANTMLRNIGDVLTNPGASPTKLLRRKSGLLESAPWWANEYDLAGNAMGMRAEAQRTRTNTAFENLAWNNAAFTSAPNAALSPLGQMTATKLQEVEGAVGFKRQTILGQGSVDTTQFETIFAKAAERAFLTLTAVRGAISGGFVIDLLTGAARRWWANSGANAKFPTIPRVELCHNGWMRVDAELIGMALFGYALGFTKEFGVGSEPPADYAGEAGAGIYVWGRNNIADPVPGSLIAGFEGQQATRAADQPQISIGFLPFTATEATLFWHGMSYDYDNGALSPLLQFAGPGGTDALGLFKDDTGTANARFTGRAQSIGNALASAQMAANLSVPVAPTPKKLALILGGGKLKVVSGDGTVEETSLAWSPFTFSRLLGGFGPGIAWHRSWTYAPRAMSVSEVLPRIRP